MTAKPAPSSITQRFRNHTLDPSEFGHEQHVRVAFDLLNTHDFIESSAIYAKGVKSLATRAGVPEKFNITITYAFLSVIAERMADDKTGSFDCFKQRNPDVMSKTLLSSWYSADQMNSPKARRLFVMPRPN